MKNEIRLALLCLAAAASAPVFAQNTTDSRCGITNYDSSRDMYTITNPTLGTATQQCFITVVPKQSWMGGVPNLSTSQLVEGNYEITLSGGGGGGGGGAGESEGKHHRMDAGAGGSGGYGAVPITTVRYLAPGVYRLTIGAGGQGGMAGRSGEHMATGGVRGVDGGPTSLAKANTNETVAGYAGAESWNGTYPLRAVGSYAGAEAPSGQSGASGSGGGAGGMTVGSPGSAGGNGYIKLALKDPVPVQAAPAKSSETAITPAQATRPAKRDRN